MRRKIFPVQNHTEYWKDNTKESDLKNYIKLSIGEIVVKYWGKIKIYDTALSSLFANTGKF